MNNIIQFDPIREIDNFFEDDWFPTIVPMRRVNQIPVNISQTNNDVIVETALPGIDPKDVEITVQDNVLQIRGEIKEKKEDRDKKGKIMRREIREGSYERIIALPTEVKHDNISAEYNNGILTITAPKAEKVKPKKISVKVKTK